MIVRAKPWGAVVLSAGREGGGVEGVDRRPGRDREGDMHPSGAVAAIADPEVGLGPVPVTQVGRAAGLLGRHFHDHRDSERGEGGVIKSPGAGDIGDGGAEMVEHGCLLWPGAQSNGDNRCRGKSLGSASLDSPRPGTYLQRLVGTHSG